MPDTTTAPAAEAKPEKVVLKQNGIKRPESGSVTGNLWDIADRISAELKRPAPRKAVVDEYMKIPGTNQATANTQYARWVAYHGAADQLRDSRKAEKAAKEAEKAAAAEKAKAEKLAARAEAKRVADEERAKKEAAAAEKAKAAEAAAAEKAKAAEAEKSTKEQERAAKLAAAQSKSVNPPAKK